MKRKIKIALCGIHEEVNTFATESMGFAKVTGNMATGFQKFDGEGLIREFKGTSTWPGGWPRCARSTWSIRKASLQGLSQATMS